MMKNSAKNKEEIKSITAALKETLNLEMCRGFVDAFLIRMQNLEVSCPNSSADPTCLAIVCMYVCMYA